MQLKKQLYHAGDCTSNCILMNHDKCISVFTDLQVGAAVCGICTVQADNQRLNACNRPSKVALLSPLFLHLSNLVASIHLTSPKLDYACVSQIANPCLLLQTTNDPTTSQAVQSGSVTVRILQGRGSQYRWQHIVQMQLLQPGSCPCTMILLCSATAATQ